MTDTKGQKTGPKMTLDQIDLVESDIKEEGWSSWALDSHRPRNDVFALIEMARDLGRILCGGREIAEILDAEENDLDYPHERRLLESKALSAYARLFTKHEDHSCRHERDYKEAMLILSDRCAESGTSTERIPDLLATEKQHKLLVAKLKEKMEAAHQGTGPGWSLYVGIRDVLRSAGIDE